MRHVAFLLLLLTPTAYAKYREIPLSDIQATDMPRTNAMPGSATLQEYLYKRFQANSNAGPVLLVRGQGREALSEFKNWLDGKRKNATCSSDREYSLCFYSYPTASGYLTLRRVSKQPGEIVVEYEVVVQRSLHDMAPRIALIPIGRPLPGELKVTVRQLQNDRGSSDHSDWSRFVCKSTKFQIAKAGEKILLERVWAYRMPWTKEIRLIDPAFTQALSPADSLLKRIRRSLKRPINQRGREEVFVVWGEPQEALRQASNVLDGVAAASQQLPKNTHLYIAAYACTGPTYVRLSEITDRGNEILIRCRQTRHDSTDSTSHFALIPIGPRDPGDLSIKVVEDPAIDMFGGRVEPPLEGLRAISTSSHFSVQDREGYDEVTISPGILDAD